MGGAQRGHHGLRVRAAPSKIKRHVHTSALYRANKKLFFFFLLHFGKAKFDDDLKMREREKKGVRKRDGKSGPLESTFLGEQIQVQVLQAASSWQHNDKNNQIIANKKSSGGHTRSATFVTLFVRGNGKQSLLATCFHCCVFL